jgi:hypothetical protein
MHLAGYELIERKNRLAMRVCYNGRCGLTTSFRFPRYTTNWRQETNDLDCYLPSSRLGSTEVGSHRSKQQQHDGDRSRYIQKELVKR